jgi:hypothetical protein
MDGPNPTTSGGLFRYLTAFLLLVLAFILAYGLAVAAGLAPPPPSWFPEPWGTREAKSAVRKTVVALVPY